MEEIDDIIFNNFDLKDLTDDDKETMNDLIVDIFLILTNLKIVVSKILFSHNSPKSIPAIYEKADLALSNRILVFPY